jgi:hypothetical protein
LTTSPFGSYGGFAYLSIAARDALLEKAQALANDLGVQHVNVRFDAGEQTPPWAGFNIRFMPRIAPSFHLILNN